MIRLRFFSVSTISILALFSVQAALHAKDLTPMATPEKDNSGASSIDDWKPKVTSHPSVAAVALPPTPAATQTKTPVTAATPAPLPVKTPSTTPVAKKAPAPVPVAAPAPAPPPLVDTVPVARRVSMNEMVGHVASVDEGEHSLRISVEGGFNPQFAYDDKTTVISHGKTLSIDALVPGDAVTVRYIGRDMTAREIERSNSTPARQPQ